MFDAKKLRRRELFNVSITEVILLLLFLLLLIFSIFFKELKDKYDDLYNRYNDIVSNDQDIAALINEQKQWQKYSGYTGPAVIKQELAELGPSVENLQELLYLQQQEIDRLKQEITQLEKELEELKPLKEKFKSVKDLEEKLKQIAKFEKILSQAESQEEIDKLISTLEQLIQEYKGDFTRLVEELEKLIGNAIPQCWPDSYPNLDSNKGERIFTIRLQPKGIWVEPDFNTRFNNEYRFLNINENVFQKSLPTSIFLDSFRGLFELSENENPNAISITEKRRCRHEVRIFDELSNDKLKYKEQMRAIEGYFYIFEFKDDNYCDYRRKNKEDNICINK